MSQDHDQSLGRLIRLAGEREMPSSQAMERARLAAEQAWLRSLQRPRTAPRRGRFATLLALSAAAGIAVLAFYGWNRLPTQRLQTTVAKIAAFEGTAMLRDTQREAPLVRDAEILSGMILMTGDGRVATSFSDTLSLRLDRHTRVRFDSRTHVTLLEGSLYVDSGGLGVGPPLAIATPAGEVSHVGTQFQVSVSGESTRVQVREGRVLLERGFAGVARAVAAGDALEVRGREEHWSHGLPSFGPSWEWSASVAPTLAIEDRPLAEFLSWIAREHGWQLHHGDSALQARMHEIRLHGSLAGLDAAAMLERVTLVTGVPLQVREGELLVGGR